MLSLMKVKTEIPKKPNVMSRIQAELIGQCKRLRE